MVDSKSSLWAAQKPGAENAMPVKQPFFDGVGSDAVGRFCGGF
jgi:hypothetical protein